MNVYKALSKSFFFHFTFRVTSRSWGHTIFHSGDGQRHFYSHHHPHVQTRDSSVHSPAISSAFVAVVSEHERQQYYYPQFHSLIGSTKTPAVVSFWKVREEVDLHLLSYFAHGDQPFSELEFVLALRDFYRLHKSRSRFHLMTRNRPSSLFPTQWSVLLSARERVVSVQQVFGSAFPHLDLHLRHRSHSRTHYWNRVELLPSPSPTWVFVWDGLDHLRHPCSRNHSPTSEDIAFFLESLFVESRHQI
mmetsp:Transcript_17680/g.29076  ORF Transcript_17680/g.29076 Transcript_17680/m.29076 type:complete len:247 (+) Transcript_17680:45-785(+)